MPARPGDPLRIPAATWNRVEALANAATVGAPGSDQLAKSLPIHRLKVRNATASNFDVRQVLELKQPDLDPEVVVLAQQRHYFEIKAAEWYSSLGSLVIALQPIPAGAVGWVGYQGMTVASVMVDDVDDQFASLDPEDPTRLRSCNCGEFRLWKPGGTGERLCVVELGGRCQLTWKYKLQENHTGTATTTAKLCRLSETIDSDVLYHDDAEIELLDAEQLVDDQDLGDIGWCIQVANQFHAIQGPC